LMGRDFPLMRASRLVTQVEESGLSEDDKAAILGGNAEKLLTT
ncbi:MAG: amidohydrolase, partial [Chloroflexi bacterium]|nr:amidohydrolase [Chloroflexota bacterium]